MEYGGYGNLPPPGQVPTLDEMIDRFPGPIAVPAEPVAGGRRSVTFMANDYDPWTIDVGYMSNQGHLLTIRTVRSSKELDPYGLPVEDLSSAVINAGLRDRSIISGEPVTREDDSEASVLRQMAQIRLLRSEVAATPASEISVTVDEAIVRGIRVNVRGWSAAELHWDEQRVFAAGRPELIDDLRLRSAYPGELFT